MNVQMGASRRHEAGKCSVVNILTGEDLIY